MFEVGKLYEIPDIDTIMKVSKIDGSNIHYSYVNIEWTCQQAEQVRPMCQMATGWTEIKEKV